MSNLPIKDLKKEIVADITKRINDNRNSDYLFSEREVGNALTLPISVQGLLDRFKSIYGRNLQYIAKERKFVVYARLKGTFKQRYYEVRDANVRNCIAKTITDMIDEIAIITEAEKLGIIKEQKLHKKDILIFQKIYLDLEALKQLVEELKPQMERKIERGYFNE